MLASTLLPAADRGKTQDLVPSGKATSAPT